MALTPKHEKFEDLKTESDLDEYLQYAFSHRSRTNNSPVTIDSREYDLTAEEILNLGKQAGYTVEPNSYDPRVINFS